ncbi:MAG TPA: LysR family transcriptional regulator [Kiritimatiellia bacterium]|nr:LysR family transcriptional regulator [Kiritimatiellia bacterium]HMO99101.1 LysR family transcriptional regulator [Kiritimatiellia bacterium]HMP96935.1 LysR family transcriptional regulator [Kiritimatiellia bacterium]
MRINYNHLRYFWFVARDGRLTRAARELHVSQSALSVQIKTLEAQLGHDLFERRGKQLLLTETGRMVLEYADSIFRTGEELLHQLAHNREVPRRVFRVGAITTLSRNFQIGFLQPLLKMKDVELMITSASLSELLLQLETHRLDVALTDDVPMRDAATSWIAHRISDQPVSLVGDPKFARRKRGLHDLLSSEPLVLPARDSNIRIAFDALVERLGIRPHIAAEISDMTMLRLIAREKTGLAVVPPIVVKDELKQGLLKEIHKIPDIQETFYAVTLKRRFPNPLLKKLL